MHTPLPTAVDDFGDLDASPNADELLAHQSAMAALVPIREAKQRSYEMLGAEPGMQVLDVGCGPGHDVKALATLVAPGGVAVGTDRSIRAIQQAQKLNDHRCAHYVPADALALPFNDGAFDATRTERCLQYVGAPVAALREISRVTRAGGPVVLVEPHMALRGSAGLDQHVTSVLLGRGAPGTQWVSRFLPLAVRKAGLVDAQLDQHVGSVASWEEVRVALNLPWVADWAVAAALLPAARVRKWVETCRTGVARGVLTVEVRTLLLLARGGQ